MISYSTGETVIVSVFGKNKVNTLQKDKEHKGYRYVVKTEDGRVVEDLYVDDFNLTSYIDSDYPNHLKNI